MTTEITINIAWKTSIIRNSGVINLYHLSIGNPINPHSVATAVGQNMLENPSPNWNASVAVCLVTPSISASGTMIGIEVAACPLPDGMKKFVKFCTTNINNADTYFEEVETKLESAYTTVHQYKSGHEQKSQ